MGYRNLQQCVRDLESAGQLVRLTDPVDARLEAAEIHRRVYRAGGPAVLYENVVGCRFPMVSNLFGTLERARFLFRDTLERVRQLVELKIDPTVALRRPWKYWRAPGTAWTMLPRECRRGPATECVTQVSQLPQLHSWPRDVGAFVTLPLVYTEHPAQPGLGKSNLGMYRIQLSGGEYEPDREVGLHYQLHRGIGIHQAAACEQHVPLRVNVFVGGAPAMTVAAVMPLPEGLSELTFAGALGGQRIRMIRCQDQLAVYAEADFCLSGTVEPGRLLPEGPFGDHLGYYSLAHDFPVLRVDRVYHRRDAIWPFTVVGRPPQEDTSFGALIHELTGPIIPSVLPGVQAVHAVDEAGVHPLLLAIGSERYTPYQSLAGPQELLTQSHALLGQGQLSLAKYLWIAHRGDAPELDIHDVRAFFEHMLQRVDWRRDLHFHTRTTIDTLDYSGSGLNRGSKLVVAAVGPPRRELPTCWPPVGTAVPPEQEGFRDPQVCFPGVLAVNGPTTSPRPDFSPRPAQREALLLEADRDSAGDPQIEAFCRAIQPGDGWDRFPLIVIVDDSRFVARQLANFLWVVFTRSDPAADVYGAGAFVHDKHWGCRGPLVIDARIKPHHAPELSEDPEVVRRVDALAARGGPLSRWL